MRTNVEAVMTAPSHLRLAGRPVSRRRLRRMSRRFAAVGVNLSADRLAEIAGGAPATDAELTDVAFAETATRFRDEQGRARRSRASRRCVHSAIVIGATVIALASVLLLGLTFFFLAEQTSPF